MFKLSKLDKRMQTLLCDDLESRAGNLGSRMEKILLIQLNNILSQLLGL